MINFLLLISWLISQTVAVSPFPDTPTTTAAKSTTSGTCYPTDVCEYLKTTSGSGISWQYQCTASGDLVRYEFEDNPNCVGTGVIDTDFGTIPAASLSVPCGQCEAYFTLLLSFYDSLDCSPPVTFSAEIIQPSGCQEPASAYEEAVSYECSRNTWTINTYSGSECVGTSETSTISPDAYDICIEDEEGQYSWSLDGFGNCY